MLTSRVVGIACIVMLAVLPTGARAATVSMERAVIAMSPAADERNDVTITVVGRSVLVHDTGAPVAAGPGCLRRTAQTVACGLGEQTRIVVDLGDGDDDVLNDSELGANLYGGSGDDSLIGGTGADQIRGGDGFDDMDGRGGPDSISTRGLFIDRVVCGSGEDFVYADASDIVADDCEHIARPSGVEREPTPGNPPDVVTPEFTPSACTELQMGTEGNDDLRGDVTGDVLLGVGGNDRLQGASGDDCLFGGAGRDEVVGDENDDFLAGGHARDLLNGGTGDDRLGGNGGADQLDGGAGADRLAGSSGADLARGGRGDDLISGGADHDLLKGGAGDDVLAGRRGADQLRAGPGRDRLAGGRGDDVVLARDHRVDRIRCGHGADAVRVDRLDRVGGDCEEVRRR